MIDRYLPMSTRTLTYGDCCLLSNINLNSERVSHYLEIRFKSNSTRTSFDFKLIPPDQPSSKMKISRSFLKYRPKSSHSKSNNNESILSDVSDDDNDDACSQKSQNNPTNDDSYLDELAEWDPGASQPTIEIEEEYENEHPVTNDNTVEIESIETPTIQAEEILITFTNRALKHEPTVQRDTDFQPSQLDGQNDFTSDNENDVFHRARLSKRPSNSQSTQTASFDDLSQRSNSQTGYQPLRHSNEILILREYHPIGNGRTSSSHTRYSLFIQEKTIGEHLDLVEEKINTDRRRKTIAAMSQTVQKPKEPMKSIKTSKAIDLPAERIIAKSRKRYRRSNEHHGKTLLDYFEVQKHSPNKDDRVQYFPVSKSKADRSHQSSAHRKRKRSATHFDGCVVIDDDEQDTKKLKKDDADIQIIDKDCCSIAHNIRSREKLLDYAVNSSEMRIRWLINLELLLLEHVAIYQKEKVRLKKEPVANDDRNGAHTDVVLSYSIDTSFISTIILNFLKMFIIRNVNYELILSQFAITSHLRYILLEMPTYNHRNLNESTCLQCSEYVSMINTLFDVLFDIMEYDLCEIHDKRSYRSSLIQDDYFHQFTPKTAHKTTKFCRVKLIIYLIELLGLHINKCHNPKVCPFINEKKHFQSVENILRHIIVKIDNSSTNERISICLNVMELCLLFAGQKEYYIKQMALLLTKLCEEHPAHVQLLLFDENVLPDVRLLLINELVYKKFRIKLSSLRNVNEFFGRIQKTLTSLKSVDDMTLMLSRSLFDTYADLIGSIKSCAFMKCTDTERMVSVLRDWLHSAHLSLTNISDKSQQVKRTVILFRLLICKWNRL